MIYGLTGGMGCGKSTVSALLPELGFTVIDADGVTRTLHRDPEICRQLVERFGPSVVEMRDGAPVVCRPALGKIAFSSPENLSALQAIMQPALLQAARTAIANATGPVVLDAPLLLETEWHSLVQTIVVVLCPLDTRIARIQKRDPQLPLSQIQARIASQCTDELRLAAADRLIYNSGSLADLRRQTRRVFGGE